MLGIMAPPIILIYSDVELNELRDEVQSHQTDENSIQSKLPIKIS